MKAAFAVWNQRIAPVFDVAGHVRVVEVEGGRVVQAEEAELPKGSPGARTACLAEWGVSVLVCGAISLPLELMVEAHGIRVIPFVAGGLDDVIQAWLGERLAEDRFAMPGCCGRRRCRYGAMAQADGKEVTMRGMGRGGSGGGGGQRRGRAGGQGRGGGQGGGQGRGRGLGRMGGPAAAGPAGACVCPRCGHREPHERGVPCVERVCPKCGIAMARE